jgi:hypothetical protein
MESKLSVRDRLRDRGLIDQWGFLFFALVGGFAVFLSKWYGVTPRWITLAAVASMVLYALLIGFSGTGRLRADQAGDNCYYLGLIYTLASLAYSISKFDPANSASTIVQGFGIALATTIVGLVLRVFFNQGRPDMENLEETARLELTEATARLKGEISTVVRQVNDLGRQLLQSMQEVHGAATKTMQDFSNTSVQGIQGVTSAASEAIRAEANDFAARSKKYTTTFTGLLSKLDEHTGRLEEMKESHDALVVAARLAAETATSASTTADLLLRSTAEAASAATAAGNAAASAAATMQRMSSLTTDFDRTLKAIHDTTEQQLLDLRTGPGEVVREATTSLRMAAAALQAQIADLSQTHEAARQALANQGTAAIEAVRKHNSDLETELKQSRDLVGKVHSALADMTRNLAETVER